MRNQLVRVQSHAVVTAQTSSLYGSYNKLNHMKERSLPSLFRDKFVATN